MKERDARFDNIKAILIFLVVLGHTIEYLYGNKGMYGVARAVIYSFHMPAFVFISGYFARKSKSSLPDITIKYLGTYLIFNTLFALSPWHVNSPTNFLYPQLIYWYLLCLCFWRVSIGALSKIRFIVPLSLLFTLYIGTCVKADRFMSISRAICFFSFFLIGYKFDLKLIQKLPKWLMALTLFTCLSAVVYAHYTGIIPVKMYEYIQSYEATEVTNITGIKMRIFMIAIALVITLCLIGLAPSRKFGFTIFGRNSLSIYLLHIFIIKAIAGSKIINLGSEPMNIAFSIVLSLLICLVLSIPFITSVYNKFINRVVKASVVHE